MNETDRNIERPNPLESLSKTMHGFIWFEKVQGLPPTKWRGWAAIGGNTAFSFSRINELPPDVIWWTNLPRKELWQLGRYKKFKEDNFLGVDLNGLLSETGMPNDKVSILAQRWSEVFSMVIDYLSRWAEKRDELWTWGEGTAVDVMHSIVSPKPELYDITFNRILSNAYSETVNCDLPVDLTANKRAITLYFPRVKHAQRVCSASYPVGGWKTLGRSDWPSDEDKRMEWIESNSKLPLLIQIENLRLTDGVEWDAKNWGRLFVGDRGEFMGSSSLANIWFTTNEILALNKFSTFDIVSGMQGEKWSKYEDTTGLLNADQPLMQWSMTKGIISNLLMQALMSPARDPKSRRKGAVTPRAIWMRATDKMYCFRAATIMQANDYPVLSYGNGKVQIVFDSTGSPEKFLSVARKAGLLIPHQLSDIASFDEQNVNQESMENIEDVALLDQWINKNWRKIYKGSNEPAFLNIDRLIYLFEETGNDMFSVIQDSGAKLIKVTENNEYDKWWKKNLRDQVLLSVDTSKAIITNKE